MLLRSGSSGPVIGSAALTASESDTPTVSAFINHWRVCCLKNVWKQNQAKQLISWRIDIVLSSSIINMVIWRAAEVGREASDCSHRSPAPASAKAECQCHWLQAVGLEKGVYSWDWRLERLMLMARSACNSRTQWTVIYKLIFKFMRISCHLMCAHKLHSLLRTLDYSQKDRDRERKQIICANLSARLRASAHSYDGLDSKPFPLFARQSLQWLHYLTVSPLHSNALTFTLS